MAGVNIPKKVFKDSDEFKRYACLECRQLLNEAVQLACGHRICKSCADEIIRSKCPPKCPDPECQEEFTEEDGVYVSALLYQSSQI